MVHRRAAPVSLKYCWLPMRSRALEGTETYCGLYAASSIIRKFAASQRFCDGFSCLFDGGYVMAVVKVVELIAESPTGWEDATQEALRTASATLRGIKSIWISEMQALVRDNKITAYRVNCKVSFEIEEPNR
jgi:flavin-binding protein dodecin